MHKVFIYILASCMLGALCLAQIGQVKMLDDSIKIGDPSQIRYQFTPDSNYNLVNPTQNWPKEIELLEDRVDTLDNQNLIRTLTFTAFESGDYLLRPLVWTNQADSIRSKAFRLHVKQTVVDTTQTKIYPIKPILQENFTWEDYWNKYWPYILVLAGVLLILLVILLLYIKSNKPKEKEVVFLSPEEEALQGLEKIKLSEHTKKQKLFYSELVAILKRYIDRRMNYSTQELISSDLIELLNSNHKLEENDAPLLRNLLNNADGVKFAKFNPSLEQQKEFIEWAKIWVEKNTPILLPPKPEEQALEE